MKLTEQQVKDATPNGAAYRLLDGDGLFLEVSPKGIKSWVFRFQKGGFNKIRVIGHYPKMSVVAARKKRDAMVDELPEESNQHGRRPFQEIAREWHEVNLSRWKPDHAADILSALEAEVFPKIGRRPINKITAPEALGPLRAIEARGAQHVAHKVRRHVSMVFDYAMSIGAVQANPVASMARALKPLPRVTHMPALTKLSDVRAMLAIAESEPAYPVTRLALRLSALTVLRPGEIRKAAWSEFEGLDTDSPLWRIPAHRMKLPFEHLVPLSRQALDVIAAVRTLTGKLPYVFSNATNGQEPMSENAVNDLLSDAGFAGKQTAHGLRASFSSIMNQNFRADHAIIELMLAHGKKDKVAAAYDRAEHMDRRRELAQIWADMLLEGAKPAAELLIGKRKSQPSASSSLAAG